MILIDMKSKGWLLLNVANLGPAAPRRQVEFKSKLKKSFPFFSPFDVLKKQDESTFLELGMLIIQNSTLVVFCDNCPPKSLIRDNLNDIILA